MGNRLQFADKKHYNYVEENGKMLEYVSENTIINLYHGSISLFDEIDVSKGKPYDIVAGPTANDDTRLSLRIYFSGGYGKIDSDKAINSLIDNIEPDNLPPQIYFGSLKGASLLITKGRAVL